MTENHECLWPKDALSINIRVRIFCSDPHHGEKPYCLGDYAPAETVQTLEIHQRRFHCPDQSFRFCYINSDLEQISEQN